MHSSLDIVGLIILPKNYALDLPMQTLFDDARVSDVTEADGAMKFGSKHLRRAYIYTSIQQT